MKKICFLLIFLTGSFAFAQTSKMVGEVALMSNDVERGITQTNKSPAVNAGFGYLFGAQGKIGVNAGSVSYPNESVNVKMMIYGEYKFIFSPTSDLKVKNDWVRYFSQGQRNKVIISLDQNLSGYHIMALREDNFEGTKEGRNWFGLAKDWGMGSFILNTTLGYSQVASPFENFFDTRVALTYPKNNLSISLVNTYVSKAAQFSGAADMAFFLIIGVTF